MEFTTHFELQSQTTRLVDDPLTWPGGREFHPLSCPVPRDLARPVTQVSPDHNSAQSADLEWAIPASVALTEGILVSFFSSAYLYA